MAYDNMIGSHNVMGNLEVIGSSITASDMNTPVTIQDLDRVLSEDTKADGMNSVTSFLSCLPDNDRDILRYLLIDINGRLISYNKELGINTALDAHEYAKMISFVRLYFPDNNLMNKLSVIRYVSDILAMPLGEEYYKEFNIEIQSMAMMSMLKSFCHMGRP